MNDLKLFDLYRASRKVATCLSLSSLFLMGACSSNSVSKNRSLSSEDSSASWSLLSDGTNNEEDQAVDFFELGEENLKEQFVMDPSTSVQLASNSVPKVSFKNLVRPELLSQAFSKEGRSLNTFYVLTKKDQTWSNVSKLLFGNFDHADQLRRWNSGTRLNIGSVVYFSSNRVDRLTEMLSLAEDRNLSFQNVRVQNGDTLSSLAKKLYGSASAWKVLSLYNENVSDVNSLEAGQSLRYFKSPQSSQFKQVETRQIAREAEAKNNYIEEESEGVVIVDGKENDLPVAQNKVNLKMSQHGKNSFAEKEAAKIETARAEALAIEVADKEAVLVKSKPGQVEQVTNTELSMNDLLPDERIVEKKQLEGSSDAQIAKRELSSDAAVAVKGVVAEKKIETSDNEAKVDLVESDKGDQVDTEEVTMKMMLSYEKEEKKKTVKVKNKRPKSIKSFEKDENLKNRKPASSAKKKKGSFNTLILLPIAFLLGVGLLYSRKKKKLS